MSEKEVLAAVITGAHSYSVIPFHDLFASLPGIRAYVQSLDDFCSSPAEVRRQYDVLVFYNFHQTLINDADCEWYQGKQSTVLNEITANEQGLLFLHHGLLAYRDWQQWSALTGIDERGFGYAPDEQVSIEPVGQHPISTGLTGWVMTDEVYDLAEPADDRVAILHTDHPKSMRTLAWVTPAGERRIFCFASGHDEHAWNHPSFQEVLRRGLLWCANTLD